MPRSGDELQKTARPAPFAGYYLLVESQHRIRLPRSIGLIVRWLRRPPNSTDCVATISYEGSLRLWPADGELNSIHKALVTNLDSKIASGNELLDEDLEIARLMSSIWPVCICGEPSRYSFVLPEPARKLGIAPSKGELAVVFAAPSILEIWRPADWIARIRGTAEKLHAGSEADVT